MMVNVKLFAAARDLAGQEAVTVELPDVSNVAGVRFALAKAYPALATLLARSAVAVNLEYADDTKPIVDGDDLAIIPPVSGG